ncbi:MAG: alpha-L-arabinofuranosidase, partial [Steroidobacteraceae bacterium]
QLYNRHFGRIPVAVTGNSAVPPPKYPIGGDQPRVNTGSDTWPLDVAAALTADRQSLVVAVVNATQESHELRLAVEGFRKGPKGRCWQLVAPGLDAQNSLGKPPQVLIRQEDFDPGARRLAAAPTSIALYEFAAA